jgi:hypothetical protein
MQLLGDQRHGPHLPCPLPSTSNFLKAYLALAPDSPDRKIYHRRYGKKNLDRLQAEYEENEANKKWFEGNTRECCGCGTRVQKSQGCNHMICESVQAGNDGTLGKHLTRSLYRLKVQRALLLSMRAERESKLLIHCAYSI